MSSQTARWATLPMGDLADFRNGLNFSKDSFGSGLKVIGIPDFQDNVTPRYWELKEINPEGVATDEDLLHENDILFVRSNGNRKLIGRSLFIKGLTERVSHSGFTIRLRLHSSRAYPRFYAYVFRSSIVRSLLSAHGGGTNINNLNQQILRQLNVPVPPLVEQQRIAAVLSAYDDLIENNERRIRILEGMAQNLYREWFVKFRFPGHKQVKMVDSPLGKIPQGWEVYPLSAVCRRITDGSHSSPKSVDSGGYPMASVKDMMSWGFDYRSCRAISEEDFRLLAKNHCRPAVNDVLIAKDGSYLKHVFVVEEDRDIVLLSSIAILRPDVTRLLPYVLCMTLRQPETKTRLSGYVSGVALPRIILKDFAGFLMVCPPLKLQEGYWEIVSPMMGTLHVLLKKNASLRQTRDLLLPKLISGEVDVSELDITIPEDAA